MGFIVRSGLRQDPVGSYPAFSPLPRTILGVNQTRLRPTYGQNGTGRYIFWDTFRYPGIASRVPSFSRGMPPYGVRTFLWRIVNPPAIACHVLDSTTVNRYAPGPSGVPVVRGSGYGEAPPEPWDDANPGSTEFAEVLARAEL